MPTQETIAPPLSGLPGRNAILYAIVTLTTIACAWIAFETSQEKYLLNGDGWQYFNLARNLVDRHVFSLENHGPGVPNYPTMARLPGYPATLGAIRVVFGDSPWNGAIFNLVCHLLTCLAITRIASRSLGFYPALVAGLLCATHVPSLYQATTLMSESSTNLIIIGMIGLYGMFRSSRGVMPLIVTGLLSGLASLYREPVFAILACGMFAFGIDFESGVRAVVKKGAVVLAFALLAYSPWIVRNYRVSGEFVPLTLFADGGGIDVGFEIENFRRNGFAIVLQKNMHAVESATDNFPVDFDGERFLAPQKAGIGRTGKHLASIGAGKESVNRTGSLALAVRGKNGAIDPLHCSEQSVDIAAELPGFTSGQDAIGSLVCGARWRGSAR